MVHCFVTFVDFLHFFLHVGELEELDFFSSKMDLAWLNLDRNVSFADFWVGRASFSSSITGVVCRFTAGGGIVDKFGLVFLKLNLFKNCFTGFTLAWFFWGLYWGFWWFSISWRGW